MTSEQRCALHHRLLTLRSRFRTQKRITLLRQGSFGIHVDVSVYVSRRIVLSGDCSSVEASVLVWNAPGVALDALAVRDWVETDRH